MEVKVNQFGTVVIDFSTEEIKKVEEIKSKVSNLGNQEIPPIEFFFAKYCGGQPAITCEGEVERYLFAENKISAKLTVASLTEMPNRFQLLAGVYFAEAIKNGAGEYSPYFEPLFKLREADRIRKWLNSKMFNIDWTRVAKTKLFFKEYFDYENRWTKFLSISISQFEENCLFHMGINEVDGVNKNEICKFIYRFFTPLITKNNMVENLDEEEIQTALKIFYQNGIKFKRIEMGDNKKYIMIL